MSWEFAWFGSLLSEESPGMDLPFSAAVVISKSTDLLLECQNKIGISTEFLFSSALNWWVGTNCSRWWLWRINLQWQLCAANWIIVYCCGTECRGPVASWQLTQPHIKNREFLRLTDIWHCLWDAEFQIVLNNALPEYGMCVMQDLLKKWACLCLWRKIPELIMLSPELLYWHVESYFLNSSVIRG